MGCFTGRMVRIGRSEQTLFHSTILLSRGERCGMSIITRHLTHDPLGFVKARFASCIELFSRWPYRTL